MNDVYLITNRLNGFHYVGASSAGYKQRFKRHCQLANNGSTALLHKAIREDGVQNFTVELLETGVSNNDVADRERYYIQKYNSYYENGLGYNMTFGGDGMVGHIHSESSKQRVRKSLLGHKFPESRNQKIRNAMLGRIYLPEWRVALSQARLGRFCAEHNAFYGKHHSAQTKSIISKANTKHPVCMLDSTTHEIVQEFCNCNDAAKWLLSNTAVIGKASTMQGRIRYVCTRTDSNLTAYGFGWKFKKKSID